MAQSTEYERILQYWRQGDMEGGIKVVQVLILVREMGVGQCQGLAYNWKTWNLFSFIQRGYMEVAV
jgi:hypothetical protein